MQFISNFSFPVFDLIIFLMAELCFVIHPLYIYIIIANRLGCKFLKDHVRQQNLLGVQKLAL